MPLPLGTTRGGQAIALSDEERSRHVHIIGASGSGKSKLMESMIRSDIASGRGLCLIDPHGTLADDILAWCAATGMSDFRRIHVIAPGDQVWCAGFNPLRQDGETDTHVRVDAMLSACAEVWGGEDTYATPLLKKCLRAVFHALASNGLTLAEAQLLTNSESSLRRRLIADLADPIFDALWRDLNALSRREFFEQFGSTNNRLLEFLGSPVVRRMVGQRDHVLDLKQVMDQGEIVIVNLAEKGALTPDNARLIGTLLTSELFLQARRRDEAIARRKPFTLYIDECYDYLTASVVKMLDQTRKFGLHAVLGHQRLGQLSQRSPDIYNGVMAGGQTKLVFGGLMDGDAEILAREVFRNSIDLERPKHILDKPVVVDEVPFWLESEGWNMAWSQSRTTGQSSSFGSSAGTVDGLSQAFDQNRNPLGNSESSVFSGGTSESRGSSESWANSVGGGHSWARSQTLKSVREDRPTAVYSLDEAMHLAIVRLRELPNRAAIVRRRGRPSIQIRTPEVRDALASPERTARFIAATQAASPFMSQLSDVDAEIARRIAGIEAARSRPVSDEAEFWSPAP
jgi:hypothetical protein